MVDEYSDIQTDQITEVFKRAMSTASHRPLITRGKFAQTILNEVIRELERDRAIWPDVRRVHHYLLNKYR
ncbi:hypothetical protein LCGC14_0779120 [marine sediment metagenome]|uniref:Uncharacterized protein n=1 Tax=marine sediment metagenome TaxID=412755 RepID=A0A0F9T370_9ZZZZ